MKNILFLHGMASSHESDIPLKIREFLPSVNVLAPDLSIDPDIAFPQIEKILNEHEIDLIIGHSLGGFMAQKFRGYRKILLNPSLGMSYMYLFQGDNKYKMKRMDGNQIWHVEKRMCKRYKELQSTQYQNITKEEDDMTIAFFGKFDFMTRMSAHWFKQHYSHRYFMPGSHDPSEDAIKNYIVPAIKKVLLLEM